MNLLKTINPENVSEQEAQQYTKREAGRAVVIDQDNNIALLYVSKENYYKLPGGGVETGEDKLLALSRECIEEIGCDIEIIGELGSIIEYRKIFSLNQTSYCFFAKVKGQKGIPDFTESEKQRGFEILWVPYEEAIKLFNDNKATSIEGSLYITPRDLTFLEKAKSLIK